MFSNNYDKIMSFLVIEFTHDNICQNNTYVVFCMWLTTIETVACNTRQKWPGSFERSLLARYLFDIVFGVLIHFADPTLINWKTTYNVVYTTKYLILYSEQPIFGGEVTKNKKNKITRW